MSDADFDVAIVGAGPVGLTLANLLGASGIRVALIERNETTVQEPRAVSIDDESLRTMQAAGLIDAVLQDVALDYGSHYFTLGGVCFAKVEPATREYGYPRRNAFMQPRFEATLREGLKRYPNVTALFGYECGLAEEAEDCVTLTLEAGMHGAHRRIKARYLAACDGGRSALRKAIGATLTGSTYQQRWLILDLGQTREQMRHTRVVCNPARPMITLPGPHGIRRYEFMLQDHETEEMATAPDFVRALLAAHGPDEDAPIVRSRVYTFHARTADRWQTRRIFLAGDAAHLTPPFAGQGMNSGLRDAHNLAWKLAAVVRGRLGAGVLRSYQAERENHARALIQLAVNMGLVMMPASRLQAFLVQAGFRLASFLPPVQAYFAQMKYKPKPFYRQGLLLPDQGLRLTGRMLPQPRLDRGGKLVLLDELAGNDFALIAYGAAAQRWMAAAATQDFGLADMCRIAVLPQGFNPAPGSIDGFMLGRDSEGAMTKLLPGGRDLLLVMRPDRYIAGAVEIRSEADIAAFAAEMRRLVETTWEGGLQGYPPQAMRAAE